MDRTSARIPVTLLTGFLGSGKTTLLNHLIGQPALANTLVVVNEFGAVPLDHLLVAHSAEQTVAVVPGGCLCCTVRGDLVRTLSDLPWRYARGGRRQFQRVVIETSGLADPAPILQTLALHDRLARQYRLAGVVATVDLSAGDAALAHYPEAARQVALADLILLTKSDVATDAQRDAACGALDALQPVAPRRDVVHGMAPADVLGDLVASASPGGSLSPAAGWLTNLHAGAAPIGRLHTNRTHGAPSPQAYSHALDAPVSAGQLAAWLATLDERLGPALLRFKGVVHVAGQDQPWAVHAVRHAVHPPVPLAGWRSAVRQTQLVFIVEPGAADAVADAVRALADG